MNDKIREALEYVLSQASTATTKGVPDMYLRKRPPVSPNKGVEK
jgi:hypothetical protein